MQVRNFIAAALVLTSAVAAQAATQVEVVQLPKVTVVGKAVRAEAQVVTLPRVVVVGYSLQTLQQRQLMAANAKAPALRIASN
jgi:hypothetical protein